MNDDTDFAARLHDRMARTAGSIAPRADLLDNVRKAHRRERRTRDAVALGALAAIGSGVAAPLALSGGHAHADAVASVGTAHHRGGGAATSDRRVRVAGFTFTLPAGFPPGERSHTHPQPEGGTITDLTATGSRGRLISIEVGRGAVGEAGRQAWAGPRIGQWRVGRFVATVSGPPKTAHYLGSRRWPRTRCPGRGVMTGVGCADLDNVRQLVRTSTPPGGGAHAWWVFGDRPLLQVDLQPAAREHLTVLTEGLPRHVALAVMRSAVR